MPLQGCEVVGGGIHRTSGCCAVVVTLVGCSSPDERTVIAASSEATETHTARVRLETIAGFDDEPQEPTIAEGVVDFATGAGRLTSSPGPIDDAMPEPFEEETSILIAADGAMFIGFGADPSEWVQRPPNPGPARGPDTPADPVALVSTLRSSASSIEDSWSQQRSRQPDHAADADVARGTAGRGAVPIVHAVVPRRCDDRCGRPWSAAAAPVAAGVESVSATGEAGFDIRLEPDYISWAMEFWDFGVEVDIEPPDPADIVAPGSSDLPVSTTRAAQPSRSPRLPPAACNRRMGLGDVDDVGRLEP